MKDRIEYWLRELIDIKKKEQFFKRLEIDGQKFKYCDAHTEIQLYNCMRKVAEIIGVEVTVNPDFSDENTLLSFEYEGFTFIELEGK